MNNKPLPIRLREAKKELLNSLNQILQEKELPCYLIEPYVEELHRMVSRSAQAEYEQAVIQANANPVDERGDGDGEP